ncbi:type II toxin-antitoxin system PemK/MazF family toxin [Lactobacillus sp. ESL0791]|uniref:type II toxin-antitoxin system PemK/MazF family toxin n=1 Tax=Lactobacillus sp. ESL0791 TaxID=2983234 RepID=UPI0023F7460D|nr:type II toxin-antitoxin system PemK/MazF family toxin [Lactobacillus sp. ESL0791]MDF7638676.1 type II toxin-antitoxin system PemK/MazF family toxin [Lactobacillus sp. ESL0791]
MKLDIHQGDIIWLSFDPSLGHEQKGHRPALVVSSDDFTLLTRSLVKLIPISTTKNKFPLHIPLPSDLKTQGVAEVQQETTLDLSYRRWKKVEHVDEKFLDKILQLIKETYEKRA